jgi:hypothetical protein
MKTSTGTPLGSIQKRLPLGDALSKAANSVAHEEAQKKLAAIKAKRDEPPKVHGNAKRSRFTYTQVLELRRLRMERGFTMGRIAKLMFPYELHTKVFLHTLRSIAEGINRTNG